MDAKVKKQIEDLLDNNSNEVSWRKDYSGRGMFGKTSPLAFESDLDPRSTLGKKIILKYKLSYDNMGSEWIYYQK